MKSFKKLSLYIIFSVVISLVLCNIVLKIDSDYFSILHTALTNSEDEIIDQSSKNLNNLANDIEILNLFQETYDYYYSYVPENVQNKEGYLLAELYNIYLPTVKILTVQHAFYCYLQALVLGLILGVVVYLIINLNFKFSLLKLLLGAITFVIIVFLIGGFIIGFKNVIRFHLLKYIVWSIISYIAIILINFAAQKNRINKLNQSLSNSNK